MDTLHKVELVKEFIEEAVERAASSVEKIHRTIAELPFQAVERMVTLPAPVRALRVAQLGVIDIVYKAIRDVNHGIGAFLSEQLETVEDARASAESMPQASRRGDRRRCG